MGKLSLSHASVITRFVQSPTFRRARTKVVEMNFAGGGFQMNRVLKNVCVAVLLIAALGLTATAQDSRSEQSNYNNRAVTAFNAGNYALAVDLLTHAIQIDPNNALTITTWRRILLLKIIGSQGRPSAVERRNIVKHGINSLSIPTLVNTKKRWQRSRINRTEVRMRTSSTIWMRAHQDEAF